MPHAREIAPSATQDTVLVTNCSQLLTLAGPSGPRTGADLRDLGLVADGALLLRGPRIEAAGPRAQVEGRTPAQARVVDAGRRVVLPGFVDAHTHLVFAGDRADEFELRCAGATYSEIAAKGGGIRSTVRRTRAASEDALFQAAAERAQWFLRNGTTTIEAKYGYGLTLEDELKLLRVIAQVNARTALTCVPTFLGAHEIPDEYAGRREEYAQVIIREMLPAVAADRLAEFCDVFCEPDVFPVALAERILVAARRHGFGLRMHADQLQRSGAAELAARLPVQTADHLEQIDASGIAALAASRVQPVLLPGSVYALGSRRYPPARALIAAGLALVLATDFNPGSSPTPSMPLILSLACTQMHMTPAEAISAATINAALSLNRAGEIGSLEPGKRADFMIYEASDFREIAYYFGGPRPAMVFANGVRVA
jgi:imidazolonepropionase